MTTTNKRTSSPTVLNASIIPRSEPYDITQMGPICGIYERDNISIGDRRLGDAEHGVQNVSETKSEFFGSSKS